MIIEFKPSKVFISFYVIYTESEWHTGKHVEKDLHRVTWLLCWRNGQKTKCLELFKKIYIKRLKNVSTFCQSISNELALRPRGLAALRMKVISDLGLAAALLWVLKQNRFSNGLSGCFLPMLVACCCPASCCNKQLNPSHPSLLLSYIAALHPGHDRVGLLKLETWQTPLILRTQSYQNCLILFMLALQIRFPSLHSSCLLSWSCTCQQVFTVHT